MANSLSARFDLKAFCNLQKVGPPLTVNARVQPGAGSFDSLLRELTQGTGNGQANEMVYLQRSINATTDDDIDLAGSITNPHGETVTFTALKAVVVAVDSPDGTKSVRVGPQNSSTPWQGPWGGTAAAVYITVRDWFVWYDPYAGGTVAGGSADVFRLHNPGAGAITVHLWLIGTK